MECCGFPGGWIGGSYSPVPGLFGEGSVVETEGSGILAWLLFWVLYSRAVAVSPFAGIGTQV